MSIRSGFWMHSSESNCGVYAVPAYKSEWYRKMMYDPNDKRGAYEYHRKTFGPQNQFGYKDFIPKFRAEKFDPAQWAELIRESGARYAGIAVVHHDGFGLWDSDVYRWNAGKMGPKRDLYGDLVLLATIPRLARRLTNIRPIDRRRQSAGMMQFALEQATGFSSQLAWRWYPKQLLHSQHQRIWNRS